MGGFSKASSETGNASQGRKIDTYGTVLSEHLLEVSLVDSSGERGDVEIVSRVVASASSVPITARTRVRPLLTQSTALLIALYC
jgi:hypothetical protein